MTTLREWRIRRHQNLVETQRMRREQEDEFLRRAPRDQAERQRQYRLQEWRAQSAQPVKMSATERLCWDAFGRWVANGGVPDFAWWKHHIWCDHLS